MGKPTSTALKSLKAAYARMSLANLVRLILAPAIILPSLLFSGHALANDDYTIEQEDGLFTLSANEASLSSVIGKLSEMTEIPMNIAEGQDTKVTLSFSDYTLESLIAELTSSSMIVRRDIDGDEVISEVVFMLGSEGNDVAAAALPSGEPNEGIIAGESAEAGASPTPTEIAPAQEPAAPKPEAPATTANPAPVIDPQTGQPVQATE